MDSLCIKCKGKGMCGKPCKLLNQLKSSIPRPSVHFSGPTPPEIFVGRTNYPNINAGILSPTSYETKHDIFNNAKQWSDANLSIPNILRLRSQLIYAKTNINIKTSNKIKRITEQLAMTKNPTSAEFFLKQKPTINLNMSSIFKPMINPAPLRNVSLQENVKIDRKIDYMVNDENAKATTAVNELYTSNFDVDYLQKVLSVGLLGKKSDRRMVPTRWSITAIDDIVSKTLIEKIKYYKEINDIILLNANYLGNYIEILLLPGKFCFEAIEAWSVTQSTVDSRQFTVDGKQSTVNSYAQDYESFQGRKNYASNITGGYYAMRIAVAEYLEKIKKQASVLVVRKITHDYYAPLGVGIVRETTRRAINSEKQIFDSIKDALVSISQRTKLNINTINEKSWLLNNYGKQKQLMEFGW